jgi:hypothetical protein
VKKKKQKKDSRPSKAEVKDLLDCIVKSGWKLVAVHSDAKTSRGNKEDILEAILDIPKKTLELYSKCGEEAFLPLTLDTEPGTFWVGDLIASVGGSAGYLEDELILGAERRSN